MGNKDMKLNRFIEVNSIMSFNAESGDAKLSLGRCCGLFLFFGLNF